MPPVRCPYKKDVECSERNTQIQIRLNPNRGGGLHNYGLAVDINIQDSLGQPLPMGTKVDHLGIEAHITQESELVRNGKISEAERQNRILLRRVMKEAGFRALPSEWWHFNFVAGM